MNRFASNTEVLYVFFCRTNQYREYVKCTLLLIKNYGQGGSPVEEKIIKTVTINASYSMITIPFIFGENQNKTLGLKDDDRRYLLHCAFLPTVYLMCR